MFFPTAPFQYQLSNSDRKALYENKETIRELAAPLLLKELYPQAKPTQGNVLRAGDLTGYDAGNSAAVFSANGGAYDHATGEYVDLYAKIQEERNCCFIDAVAYAAERIGWMTQGHCREMEKTRRAELEPSEDPLRAPSMANAERDHIEGRQRMQRRYAQDIWDEGVPVPGTWGDTYLSGRGLSTVLEQNSFEHCMRYHGHTWNKEDNQSYPALIFKVTCAVTDRFCGIQRVFLEEGGKGRDKRLGKRRLGARIDTFPVIKFTPDAIVNNHLSLTEGPENALSVFLLDPEGRPVWSAVDANGMRSFPVLPQLHAITLWPDNDNAGIGASDKCGARYHAAGLAVEKIIYETDPNDAVKAGGLQ